MDVLLTNSGYFNVLNVSSISKLGCSASIKWYLHKSQTGSNDNTMLTLVFKYLFIIHDKPYRKFSRCYKTKFIYQPYRIIV